MSSINTINVNAPQELAMYASTSNDGQLVAALQVMIDGAIPKVIKPAVAKVSQMIAEAEKSAVPVRTAILKGALGSTSVKIYDHIVWAAAGARRGFKGSRGANKVAYARGIRWKRLKSGKVVLSKVSKADTIAGADLLQVEIPTKIIHFAESGRGPVTIKKKKSLFDSINGKFYGTRVGPEAGTHFMAKTAAMMKPMIWPYLFGEIYAKLPELYKDAMRNSQ